MRPLLTRKNTAADASVTRLSTSSGEPAPKPPSISAARAVTCRAIMSVAALNSVRRTDGRPRVSSRHWAAPLTPATTMASSAPSRISARKSVK